MRNNPVPVIPAETGIHVPVIATKEAIHVPVVSVASVILAKSANPVFLRFLSFSVGESVSVVPISGTDPLRGGQKDGSVILIPEF